LQYDGTPRDGIKYMLHMLYPGRNNEELELMMSSQFENDDSEMGSDI
jgi:hypothetical protein